MTLCQQVWCRKSIKDKNHVLWNPVSKKCHYFCCYDHKSKYLTHWGHLEEAPSRYAAVMATRKKYK